MNEFQMYSKVLQDNKFISFAQDVPGPVQPCSADSWPKTPITLQDSFVQSHIRLLYIKNSVIRICLALSKHILCLPGSQDSLRFTKRPNSNQIPISFKVNQVKLQSAINLYLTNPIESNQVKVLTNQTKLNQVKLLSNQVRLLPVTQVKQ